MNANAVTDEVEGNWLIRNGWKYIGAVMWGRWLVKEI